MEQNIEENKIENSLENKGQNSNQKQIAGAIVLAGLLIAGAVLLKGSIAPGGAATPGNPNNNVILAKVGPGDRTLGNTSAKVTLIMYEDFQCPWCGKFENESEQKIRQTYVADGRVQIVYRDFAFLGTFVKPYVEANDESIHAAEAARCAGDQGKFWEYHDYLYSHQNGENEGGFSITNLKSFARALGLNQDSFGSCLDSHKYAQAVADSKAEAGVAGVTGTPKGFILKKGKIVDTIDGYVPLALTTQKLDAALK